MMFPIFRKYTHEKTWYRIDAQDRMMEIQVIGSNYMIHQLEAKILPERLLISDLIANEGKRWVEVSEEEFLGFELYCKENLNLV